MARSMPTRNPLPPGGVVPQVLAALGVRPSALRAAVAETGEPGGA